eukprot:4635444-Pleurochrysis_carterae.AAC.1
MLLGIDYLGEVNDPDGPPGLYDQSGPSTWYVDARIPGRERGRELQSTSVPPQFTKLIWRSPDTRVWPPTERALSKRPWRCGRSSEGSWPVSSR